MTEDPLLSPMVFLSTLKHVPETLRLTECMHARANPAKKINESLMQEFSRITT